MSETSSQNRTLQIQYGNFLRPSPQAKHTEDTVYHDEALGLFIVCDGVGGREGGEVASKMATEIVAQEIANKAKTVTHARDAAMLAESAIQMANLKIHEKSAADPKLRGMATTIDLVWRTQNYLVTAHVGDGRIYLWRKDVLELLTRDHTYATTMVREKILTPEQAAKHPYAAALEHAVGIHPVAFVEVLTPEIQDGDRVLICTDGVYKTVADKTLSKILAEKKFANELCSELLRAVNENKTARQDDASAIILNVEVPSLKTQTTGQVFSPSAKMDALKMHPFFGQLTFAERVRLEALTIPKTFKANEVIAHEGEVPTCMWVILAGRVQISEGGRPIVVREHGFTLGEAALMDQEFRSATLTALDTVRALEFPKDQLRAFLDQSMDNTAARVYKAIAHFQYHRVTELTRMMSRAKGEMMESDTQEIDRPVKSATKPTVKPTSRG